MPPAGTPASAPVAKPAGVRELYSADRWARPPGERGHDMVEDDWITLTARAGSACHDLVGWLMWDAAAIARHSQGRLLVSYLQ